MTVVERVLWLAVAFGVALTAAGVHRLMEWEYRMDPSQASVVPVASESQEIASDTDAAFPSSRGIDAGAMRDSARARLSRTGSVARMLGYEPPVEIANEIVPVEPVPPAPEPPVPETPPSPRPTNALAYLGRVVRSDGSVVYTFKEESSGLVFAFTTGQSVQRWSLQEVTEEGFVFENNQQELVLVAP